MRVLAIVSTLALVSCGGGSDDSPMNDDSGPVLVSAVQAASMPNPPSVGGLDSTNSQWGVYRLQGTATNPCQGLMIAMLASRGSPEESSADSISPQDWWYWSQGYTVTFDWSNSRCTTEDYRFTPQD